MAQDGYGSKAVLLIQLLPPQIRVRSTPNSRHDGDGPAHLRFVPQADQGFLWKGDYVFYKPGIGRPSKALLPPIASARAKTPPVAISTLEGNFSALPPAALCRGALQCALTRRWSAARNGRFGSRAGVSWLAQAGLKYLRKLTGSLHRRTRRRRAISRPQTAIWCGDHCCPLRGRRIRNLSLDNTVNADLLRTLKALPTDPARVVDLYPQLYAGTFVVPVQVGRKPISRRRSS